MDRLSQVLPKVLHKRGIAVHAGGALVTYKAREWLSQKMPHMAACLTVQKADDGVVYIACDHSIAAQECRGNSHELVQYLALECPFAGIFEVRVVRA